MGLAKRLSPADSSRIPRRQGGCLVAPMLHTWYGILGRALGSTGLGFTQAVTKVALDQLLFAPILIACFTTSLRLLEVSCGGGQLRTALG